MIAILSSDVLGNFTDSIITYPHIGFISPMICEVPLFIGRIFCSLCIAGGNNIIDQHIELMGMLALHKWVV